MSDDNNQLRGHCQICGRLQAVRNGHMAHHGYRVENGWFSGKCSGHDFQPMERDTEMTKSVLASVRAQIERLTEKLEGLKSGKLHPATVRGHYNAKLRDYDAIPWGDGTSYQQQHAVEREIFSTEMRIRGGESFITQMTALMERVHGQPLTEVKRAEKAEPIWNGERRTLPNGSVATVTRVDGARVYWSTEKGKSWTGTRAWRAYPKAA